MNKHLLVVVGIIVLLLVVGLSGCTSNPPSNTHNGGNNDNSDPVTNQDEQTQDDIDRQRFIGTWLRDDGRTQILYVDGSKEIDGEFYGYWTVENNKLVTTNPEGDISYWIYEFYADGNKVWFTSGYPEAPTVHMEKIS